MFFFCLLLSWPPCVWDSFPVLGASERERANERTNERRVGGEEGRKKLLQVMIDGVL